MRTWPAKLSRANWPFPLRASRASGSVVDPWMSVRRAWPRKSKSGNRGSPSVWHENHRSERKTTLIRLRVGADPLAELSRPLGAFVANQPGPPAALQHTDPSRRNLTKAPRRGPLSRACGRGTAGRAGAQRPQARPRRPLQRSNSACAKQQVQHPVFRTKEGFCAVALEEAPTGNVSAGAGNTQSRSWQPRHRPP